MSAYGGGNDIGYALAARVGKYPAKERKSKKLSYGADDATCLLVRQQDEKEKAPGTGR
jgi:hypothetical protein